MSFGKKVVILTDIDGTLGDTDVEICKTLFEFRSLQSKCVLGIITGRSLKGLARIQTAVPHDLYVAPWGGGNVLFYDGTYYTPIRPIKRITSVSNLDSLTCTMLQEKQKYSDVDERHILWTDRVTTDGYPVSAYKQLLETKKDSSSDLYQNSYAHITTGSGFSWLNVSPFISPRLETVKLFRQMYPEHRIVYLGDSPVDGDCLDAVDFFLTHQKSQLATIKRTITYNSFGILPSLLSSLIKAI